MGSEDKLSSAELGSRISPGLVQPLPQLHRTHAHCGRALHQGYPPGQQISASLSSVPSWNLALTSRLANAFHSPILTWCMCKGSLRTSWRVHVQTGLVVAGDSFPMFMVSSL